jgi:digalactosyldiacylglycerol synthase
VEPLRAVAGAGTNTRDNPQRLQDYQPSDGDVGGLFDDKRRGVKAHAKVATLATEGKV